MWADIFAFALKVETISQMKKRCTKWRNLAAASDKSSPETGSKRASL